MEIQMGKGEWMFSKGTSTDGRVGLLIIKADEPHEVGELDRSYEGPQQLGENRIFISMPDLKSLFVISEKLTEIGIDLLKWETIDGISPMPQAVAPQAPAEEADSTKEAGSVSQEAGKQ